MNQTTNLLYLVVNDTGERSISGHHFSSATADALAKKGLKEVTHYLRHLPDVEFGEGYNTAIEIKLGGGIILGECREDLEGMAGNYVKDSVAPRVAVTTSEKADEAAQVFEALGQKVERVN